MASSSIMSGEIALITTNSFADEMETQAIKITEAIKAMHAQKAKVTKAIAHTKHVALSPGSSEEQRTANLLTLHYHDSRIDLVTMELQKIKGLLLDNSS
eukprot:4647216-Pyramimonas_sp.AAC.1